MAFLPCLYFRDSLRNMLARNREDFLMNLLVVIAIILALNAVIVVVIGVFEVQRFLERYFGVKE